MRSHHVASGPPGLPAHPSVPVTPLDQVLSHLGLPHLTPLELIVAGVVVLAVGSFFLSVFLQQLGDGRARGAAEGWARANRFEIIKTAVLRRPRGPFKDRPSWQTVSAITVRTEDGANKSAWI